MIDKRTEELLRLIDYYKAFAAKGQDAVQEKLSEIHRRIEAKPKVSRKTIRKIIELTASFDNDGFVWGYDTEIDSHEGIIERAVEILAEAGVEVDD